MIGEIANFRFVGENLVLDFVNTKTTEPNGTVEALPSYGCAVRWLDRAGVLSSAEMRTMLHFAESPQASQTLVALLDFRGILRRMLDEYCVRGIIAHQYVDAINEQLLACNCARALEHDGDGYALRVQYRFTRPCDVLMPFANAAAELIAHEDLTRVKRCGSDCCDMYFLDTSRNRSRTWCDMAVCGNRAKSAAYYRRRREVARVS